MKNVIKATDRIMFVVSRSMNKIWAALEAVGTEPAATVANRLTEGQLMWAEGGNVAARRCIAATHGTLAERYEAKDAKRWRCPKTKAGGARIPPGW